ncbi:MAG: GAF domain-containing protein, partial [Myxococcales bacterium]|nr:GAF domain-containing protein [Myxococcales bacterium]
LMLGVHLSLAEVRQVLGEVASAQSLFDRALAETPSPLERAELLIFKIGREIALRRFTDALATGHAALALVGADVPTRGTRAALGVEVVRLRWNLRRRGKRAFLELPESNERRVHVAHSVLMHMTPAAYFTDFKLAAIILLRLANLTLERGRTEHSAYGIAGYGLVLASRPGERAAARELGEIADELLAAHPSPAIEARVDLLVGLFTLPWSGPLREARARLERGYRAALASGDLLYASFCGNHIPPFAFLGGENLGRILDLAAEQSAFLGGIGEREGEAFVGALAGLCRALRGPGPVPTRLRAEDDGEEELAASATRFRRTMGGFYIPLYRGILLFHAGEHAEAQIQFEAATQAITAVRAVPTRVDLDFFAAVNLAELASQAGPEDRGRMLATLSILVERLEGWAAAAPASYGPRWKIAAAAHAWVRGEENEVLPLLNLAITEALDTDDPHRVGVAAELAARVLQSQGITFLVEHYVDQAIAAYDEMGAAAKIASLRAVYGDRTPPTPTLSPAERPRPNPLHTETSTLVPVDGSGSKSLDLGTVIKATQALSGEIVLERLLRALVRIVMESAGARRCFLVLESEGRLLIEGEGSIDPEHVEVLGSTPIEAQSDLPLSIIKYVARAGDKVVLDHAAESGAFTKDPYVREQALKSVLCLPISQQGKVSGVLYLENNLATDVFTDDRLELLNQLAAQVAISIDNARLYDSLDRARREAVSADQAKTRFLMNMSHELRTPLNAIIGYTELIEEELEDGHVANFTDDLGSIRTAALRLERTLESALELSRIEGGTFEIADEIVDLRELVAEVVSELGPSAHDRGNRLTIDVDDPGPILGDRIRLRFCLRSLLDNAIRFTEAGEVELRLATDPGHQPPLLELVVRDTGIGIADEHMPRLFDAFTQADDSTTRAYEGSGVSLAVTRHICEAHGGTIAVGSRPGEGSRFTVELPLRRPAASA